MILDIGPKTIKNNQKLLIIVKLYLWNGPAGYFENPDFAYGSIEIAKKIIENNKENKIYSVAGGGDTVSLLNNLNAVENFNFVSTAGGAFLEYLEGKRASWYNRLIEMSELNKIALKIFPMVKVYLQLMKVMEL